MESFPWFELVYAVGGALLAFLAQWFGVKLPTLPPAGQKGDDKDKEEVSEVLALHSEAEHVAEKYGLDEKKLKALDPGTLSLILSLLSAFGPSVLEWVKRLLEKWTAKK